MLCLIRGFRFDTILSHRLRLLLSESALGSLPASPRCIGCIATTLHARLHCTYIHAANAMCVPRHIASSSIPIPPKKIFSPIRVYPHSALTFAWSDTSWQR